MIQHRAALELIETYEQKIMASKAELALLRVQRTKAVGRDDKPVFKNLLSVLIAAFEGDEAISVAQAAPGSQWSLKVLRQTLKAFAELTPSSELFRRRVSRLARTAEDLSEGRVPAAGDIVELRTFVHSYGALQADILSGQASGRFPGAEVWPLSMRVGSF